MSRYFYAVNGQTQGPVNAEQLKELTKAGQIQPQTMIFKEGQPQWAPAASYPGLLPAPAPAVGIQTGPPRPEAYPPTLPPEFPDFPPLGAPAGGGLRLWLVVGGVLGLAAAAAIVIIFLMNQEPGDNSQNEKGNQAYKETEAAPEDELPAPRTVIPPKKETTPPKKPDPLPEFTKDEICGRYQKDPQKTLQELEGKRVMLKLNFILEADNLIKLIDKDNNINLYIYPLPRTIKWTPYNTIMLTFPNVNPNSKLGFFAKIREYAEKWKRGDKVEIKVAATLGVTIREGQKYLHFKDAEVQ